MTEFSILRGETLVSITGMHRGSGEVRFVTESGNIYRMYHDQDCCESVTLEDACGDVEDLIGSPITVAECRSMKGPSRYESSTWTFYELATNRGSMTLRWLGESNGYYSESVSFEQLSYHDLARERVLEDGVYEVNDCDEHQWWLWDGESWRDYDGTVLDVSEARDRFTVLGPVLRRGE
jgi:hypothetical protein